MRRKPVLGPLAIIPTYLFMTSGYPHAAAAGVVVAAVLLGRDLLRRARPAREWVPMVSGLGAGALLGSLPWLLALAYVPYVERPSGLETVNDGGFIVHAESFLLSFSPFDRPFMINFGGSGFTDQPITYFIWTIPAAVVLFVATRRRLAEHIDLAIAAGVLCLAMTGPEVFGPIRWPFRFTPFAAMMAVLAATAIIDHASQRGITRPLTTTERRVLVVSGVALVLLAGALRPEPIVLVGTAFMLGVATPLVVWLARRQRATLLGSLIVAGEHAGRRRCRARQRAGDGAGGLGRRRAAQRGRDRCAGARRRAGAGAAVRLGWSAQRSCERRRCSVGCPPASTR